MQLRKEFDDWYGEEVEYFRQELEEMKDQVDKWKDKVLEAEKDIQLAENKLRQGERKWHMKAVDQNATLMSSISIYLQIMEEYGRILQANGVPMTRHLMNLLKQGDIIA